jgi:Protein of unknown function (DUF1761)
MQHLHHNLNLLAVLVSAVILWVLGAAWYSPALFAKPWMAALGITPDPAKKKGLLAGMIASFIGDFILAFVMDHIILWAHAGSVHGAFIGFIVWLGFFAAPNFPQGIYENRPFRLFAINNGYWLVGLIIVGLLLAVWR